MRARKPIDNDAIDKIELRPDAWERFERKLKEAVRSSPTHTGKRKPGPKRRKRSTAREEK